MWIKNFVFRCFTCVQIPELYTPLISLFHRGIPSVELNPGIIFRYDFIVFVEIA